MVNVSKKLRKEVYSTDEVFTGKYWIDGKKIYRKTIIQNLNTAHTENYNVNHNIVNIENITKIESIMKRTNSNNFVIPSYETADYYFLVKATDNSQLSYKNKNYLGTAYTTLEYTKTN